jgi:serine/threonine protein kinase
VAAAASSDDDTSAVIQLRGFPEYVARFLLTEIYLGLEHMHSHGFIHRDVKLENIMLNAEGHVVLIDFGMSTKITSSSSSSSSSLAQQLEDCGTMTYSPPELLTEGTGGRHTDWWALGVVAYELMTALCPWKCIDENNKRLLQDEIVMKAVKPPSYLSSGAQSLIVSLLQKEYRLRLGTSSDVEIRSCDFFQDTDWEMMEKQQVVPPIDPGGGGSNGGSNVDKKERLRAVKLYEKMLHA